MPLSSKREASDVSVYTEGGGQHIILPFGLSRRRVRNFIYFEYSLYVGIDSPSCTDSLELVPSILVQSMFSHLFYVLNFCF